MPHIKVEVQILVTVNVYQPCDRWLWDCAICSANQYIWLSAHVDTAWLSLRYGCMTATSRKARRDAKHYDVRCEGLVRQGFVADRPLLIRVAFITCKINNVLLLQRVRFLTCTICNAYLLIHESIYNHWRRIYTYEKRNTYQNSRVQINSR